MLNIGYFKADPTTFVVQYHKGKIKRQGVDFHSFTLPWLHLCVREPFHSHTTGTSLVYGKIEERDTFKLASQMAEGGIIFSDGIVDDAIEFNSGTIASIGIASVQGQLVAN